MRFLQMASQAIRSCADMIGSVEEERAHRERERKERIDAEAALIATLGIRCVHGARDPDPRDHGKRYRVGGYCDSVERQGSLRARCPLLDGTLGRYCSRPREVSK